MRDEKVIPLEDAIRRLTGLPAENLELDRRGFLGRHFADVTIFDPATIADHATFEKPHQFAIGMRHVFVNGQVLRERRTHGRRTWPGRTRSGKK